MVTFQHGPELYDEVVQRLSRPWPRFGRWGRRKLVIDVPFWRFSQLQGGVGHVSQPVDLGALAHVVEILFVDGEIREFALLRVGVEAIGHDMPFPKSMKMMERVKPITEAGDGGGDKGDEFFASTGQLARGMAAEELAGDLLLDGKGGGRIEHVSGH